MRRCSIESLDQHEYGPFALQISTAAEASLYLLFAHNEPTRDIWVQVLKKAAQPD